MSIGTQVLTGARDRLLPASVPYAFFGVACLYHLLAWAALLRGAVLVPGYAGGPGPVLAAIHLITLGVLALTAMGAAYQLLPVASREPLWRVWPARLSFWLAAPGVAVLAWGMDGLRQWAMTVGGGMVAAGLGIFGLLIASNLYRARGLPVVIAHGWAALAALAALVTLGLALIGNYAVGYLDDPSRFALAHMVLGIFGFMTLLAFGFSHILIPMFALSRTLPVRWAWAEFALSALAVAAAVAAVAAGSGPGMALAAAVRVGEDRILDIFRCTQRNQRVAARLGLPLAHHVQPELHEVQGTCILGRECVDDVGRVLQIFEALADIEPMPLPAFWMGHIVEPIGHLDGVAGERRRLRKTGVLHGVFRTPGEVHPVRPGFDDVVLKIHLVDQHETLAPRLRRKFPQA